MANSKYIKYSSYLAAYLIAIGALIGCAATTPPARTVFGTKSVLFFPETGNLATADIGQSILSKAYLTKSSGIKIPEEISEIANPPGLTTIKSGSLPLSGSNELGKFYIDTNATYTMLGATVPVGNRAGIFIPNNTSQPSVIYHYTSSYNFGKNPITGIQSTIIETWGEDSFKRELIYLGVQQNTITIQYREFKNDIARPAFSQEIKYDLSQGKEIGYKGARFEITKATNTELTYKVLKPLD
jgi:hypothetical protein